METTMKKKHDPFHVDRSQVTFVFNQDMKDILIEQLERVRELAGDPHLSVNALLRIAVRTLADTKDKDIVIRAEK